MKARSVRLALVFAMLIAVVGSFVILTGTEDSAPLGVKGTVQVAGPSPSVPASQTVRSIEETARDSGADLVKLVDDMRDPGAARTLYVAVGNGSGQPAGWLAHGYPAFSRSVSTKVLAFGDLEDQDPRGNYFVFGNAQATGAFADRFRADGYQVDVRTDYTLSYLAWLANQPLGTSFIVGVLLCVMLAGMFALLNAKGYAVQRLQGNGSWSIIGRDVRANARFAGTALAVVAVLFIGFLAWYNHARHLGKSLALAAAILACFLAFIMVAYLFGFALTSRSRLLESLKGRLPRFASTLIYCVRIPAVIIAAWAMVYAGYAATQALGQVDAQQAWQSAGQASAIHLNPRLSQEEQDEYSITTGNWLISQERQGTMILAQEATIRDLPIDTSAMPSNPGLLDTDTLTVNSNYLRAQHITDQHGQRITQIPANGVLIILPDVAPDQQESLTRAVRSYIAGQAQMYDVNPQVSVLVGSRDQSVFGYGQTGNPNAQAIFHDAVLIATNADSGIFSPDDYTSFASQGNALLTDPDESLISLREAGLQPFIFAISSASANAASEFAKLQMSLRIHLMNVLIAIAILIASGLAAAQTHVRVNAQQVFARYVHGWSFPAIHRRPTIVETLIAIIPVLWSVNSVIQSQHNIGTPSATSDIFLLGGWQPALIAGVTIVNLLIYLAATSRYSRTLVANHSREE